MDRSDRHTRDGSEDCVEHPKLQLLEPLPPSATIFVLSSRQRKGTFAFPPSLDQVCYPLPCLVSRSCSGLLLSGLAWRRCALCPKSRQGQAAVR